MGMPCRGGWRLCASLLVLATAVDARAEQASPATAEAEDSSRWWYVGGQVTSINQINTRVSGPFNPALSYGQVSSYGWSLTATFFGAISFWKGGSFVLAPEYANGLGLPNASGLGGYPNGEIVRVPSLGNEPYIARAFFHQDLVLGPSQTDDKPEMEARFAPSGVHAFAGGRSTFRLSFTIGKFAANDFFDVSTAASDPRHHFMNWALMDNGAWDYAADTRGYTVGAVLEWESPQAAVRAGFLTMPATANGSDLDFDYTRASEQVVEAEWRYHALGRAGTVKLLAYLNRADMGNYNQALASAPPGSAPQITSVRQQGALKYGGGLLVEQGFAGWIEGFLRVGANDGQTETFAFTEIDQTISMGVDVAGTPWKREGDHLAAALAVNGLSAPHSRYLAAGGVGFELGDGSLRYAPETIMEAFYLWRINEYVELTADLQAIANPGMNAERGPSVVFGGRLHGHF